MLFQPSFQKTGQIGVRTLVVKIFTLLLLGSGIAFNIRAQTLPDSSWIDVVRIRFSEDIRDHCGFAAINRYQVNSSRLTGLSYRYGVLRKYRPDVPMKFMEMTCVYRFALENQNAFPDSLFFSPGYYFRDFKLYKAGPEPGSLRESEGRPIYNACYQIILQPGEKAVYYVTFNLIRTNVNLLLPTLIEKDYLPSWLNMLKHRDDAADTISYVITGLLLLMIFYSLAVYLRNRNAEFIYYSVYAFCSASLVFLKSYLKGDNHFFNIIYEEFLDIIILGIGVFFYLWFIRQFTNTRTSHPFLEKWLKTASRVLLGMLAIFSVIYFFTSRYAPLFILENYIIKIFLLLLSLIFIVYSIRRRDALLNFLAAGNFALLFFSLISLAFLLGFRIGFIAKNSVWNNGMLYYELGLVLELFFFLSGLAFKNRRELIEKVKEQERLKRENERKEFEKQMAVMGAMQEERDRISADMHDELGSGMTAIRLMSEIAKTKMENQPLPELEKISNSANDLLGKMNTIIWTMKSSNDTLDSLVAYIRVHALEYFENTPVHCKVDTPETIPDVEISSEKRRNIFLSVKESLHNVLKHAQASEVRVAIRVEVDKLYIGVSDNGIGMEKEKLNRFGNGLSNMKRRMESIGGSFGIECGRGCTLWFSLALSPS